MNNKDNYKKAIDQIHASDELKEKAFENAKYASSSKYSIIKYLSVCAAVMILVLLGINYLNIDGKSLSIAKKQIIENEVEKEEVIEIAKLPKFENMQQLKNVIKENGGYYESDSMKSINSELAITETTTVTDSMATASEYRNETQEKETASDYSTTNVQVENVDEADIVKTDGEFIYYVSNNIIHIVKADNLEIINELKIEEDDERFTISEIYLNNNKLVLIGTSYTNEEPIIANQTESKVAVITAKFYSVRSTKAIIYDVENKEEPVKTREVALEGNYVDSRLIDENLYLISRKNASYYDNLDDNKILPKFKDTVNGEEMQIVECTDIAYFEGTEENNFMMVGGFNINNENEVFVETFFGAGELVYANEKSLYLTQSKYDTDSRNTLIYKFTLKENKILLTAKGKVNGILNNQFSMDEYDGNLRIATTSTIVVEPEVTEEIGNGIMKTTKGKTTTTNNLYILNDNLEEIGKIENLANDEKIYSVRFIGKVGYIVTFEQIDPLFVIDLSDSTNPVVKGELKIPGYSSYLHPYDENHIIGIGYNTKDNGFGGVTNSNMKMSMFDISDLENPKEIFNVDIGDNNVYSEVTYNHKALFYKKSENLIGFPITNYMKDENGFSIYKINLDENKFEKYGEILKEINYKTNVDRIIYIEDVLYTLSDYQIISYDLSTLEKLNEVNFSQTDSEEEMMYKTITTDTIIIE